MPLYIDEAWEYFLPDEEVAELLHATGSLRSSAWLADFVDFRREAMPGLRFGRGNPNGSRFRLAPERRKVRESVAPRVCPGCGFSFIPDRTRRKFCGADCTPVPPGRERILDDRSCKQCGTVFRPERDSQTFCTPVCAVADRAKPIPGTVPAGFGAAYASGEPMAALAGRFGVSLPTVKRWRKTMGLPSRPIGRPSHKSIA